MKGLALTISGLAFFLGAGAQKNIVNFNYRAEKVSDKVYTLHITANIAEGWHIYSQDQPKQAVSQPTRIVFRTSPLFALNGKTLEIGDKKKFENKVVDIVQYQYGDKVEFVQKLTLKAPVKSIVSGNITYQACTDESCLTPQTIPFELSLN